MKITYKAYHAVASWRWDVDPNHSNPPPVASDPQSSSSEIDDSGLVGDSDQTNDANAKDDDDESDEESEEEDEMCGVCQQEFESACPACKVPGDDCPLSTSVNLQVMKGEEVADGLFVFVIDHLVHPFFAALARSALAVWGACKHVFHMHCLLQWLQTPSSKEQCPLDRRPWGESPSLLQEEQY
jgi:anaphase-promoting complex subunit 11